MSVILSNTFHLIIISRTSLSFHNFLNIFYCAIIIFVLFYFYLVLPFLYQSLTFYFLLFLGTRIYSYEAKNHTLANSSSSEQHPAEPYHFFSSLFTYKTANPKHQQHILHGLPFPALMQSATYVMVLLISSVHNILFYIWIILILVTLLRWSHVYCEVCTHSPQLPRWLWWTDKKAHSPSAGEAMQCCECREEEAHHLITQCDGAHHLGCAENERQQRLPSLRMRKTRKNSCRRTAHSYSLSPLCTSQNPSLSPTHFTNLFSSRAFLSFQCLFC